jgi:hypothetical protein
MRFSSTATMIATSHERVGKKVQKLTEQLQPLDYALLQHSHNDRHQS